MNIVIPSKVIKAALICAARNDVRHYLNGILIEPAADLSAVYVVAADGNRMVCMRVKQKAGAIPADMRAMILSTHGMLAASKNETVLLNGIDDRSEHMIVRSLPGIGHSAKRKVRTAGWHLCAEIPGRFPDWRYVVASAVNRRAMDAPGAQHEYLNGLQQIYCLLASQQHQNSLKLSVLFQMVQRGHDAMTLAIPTDDGIEAIAIVMPMRPASIPGADFPAWAKSASPIEVKPAPAPKPATSRNRAQRAPAAKKAAKKAA